MIEALVEPGGDGGWVVKAPHVGFYRGCPPAGGQRSAGDTVGRLAVLNRSKDLVLPAGVDGLVSRIQVRDRATPVEYSQTLFELAPVAGAASVLVSAAPALRAAETLPDGCQAVTCPIDGVFYRCASPNAPPFVVPGDIVETGRTLGLIEAMKSFNAVAYGGPGLPARAVIVEARVADASDVRQGAVLFVVRMA